MMRTAANISDQSFLETLEQVHAGMTEKEVAAILFQRMVANGSDHHLSFDLIVGSGPRGADAHCIASEKILMPGELVVIDFGCSYRHYTTDTTRTIAIEYASDRQMEIYHHVQTAQRLVLDQIRQGMTNAQAHRLVVDYMQQHGYGSVCGNTLGHGIGLETEETPLLIDLPMYFPEFPLEAGMVTTIEPGIYLNGEGGVRIEDDVVITETGAELLTQLPRDLIIVH